MQEYDVYYTNGRPYPNHFSAWEGKVHAPTEKEAVEIVANDKVVHEQRLGNRIEYTMSRGTKYLACVHKEFAG